MNHTLGLDIGGANIKASNGLDRTIELPFPMWKTPDQLSAALSSIAHSQGLQPDSVAVTMTGELADCFRTKREGVEYILDSVVLAFPQSEIRVWQTGAEFLSVEEAREFTILVAAANWHALATWAGRACPSGAALLIDIGSTTTDIIPLFNGIPVSKGGTDTARLISGELVYSGVRRTPLCAFASQVSLRGQPTGVAAEHFATTHDVYVWMGMSAEVPDDTHTANGRPATREYARDRMARMLCADIDELSNQDLDDLTQQWHILQKQGIRQGLEQVLKRQPELPHLVLLSGEGEFLTRKILTETPSIASVEILSLTQSLGPAHSIGACAYALARLSQERP